MAKRLATRPSLATAVGAFALGALALGAIAVGAVAIGRLSLGRGHVKYLEIDELVVHKVALPDPDSDASTPG